MQLKKKLFKYQIKLLLCYIKTAMLFLFVYMWLFFPVLVLAFSPKSELFALLCVIMCIINFNLIDGTNKWFNKIKNQKSDFQSSIIELQYLIDEK